MVRKIGAAPQLPSAGVRGASACELALSTVTLTRSVLSDWDRCHHCGTGRTGHNRILVGSAVVWRTDKASGVLGPLFDDER